MENISSSMEMYLETVLLLEKDADVVRLTDVANKLGVSKASANRAQGVLKDAGFIMHKRYGTISLTDKGREAANEVYSRHVMFKEFLMNVLDIDEKTAEQDACRMEHVVSEETMKKLTEFLKERC